MGAAVGKQEITDGKNQHACPWEEVFKCLIWRMPSVPSPASGVLTRLLSQSCEDDLGPGSNEIPGASFAAFLNLIRSRASSTDYLCPTPNLLCFSGFQIQSRHTAKSDSQTNSATASRSLSWGQFSCAWMRFHLEFFSLCNLGACVFRVCFLSSDQFDCPKYNMQELGAWAMKILPPPPPHTSSSGVGFL